MARRQTSVVIKEGNMNDIMFVLLTVLFIVIAAIMILKKMDSKLVFFFVGTVALLVVTLITGESVLGDKTTGNMYLDVVDVIRTKFISTVQGTGIRLMVVASYVMLMNHMGASKVLAAAVGRVLVKLKSPCYFRWSFYCWMYFKNFYYQSGIIRVIIYGNYFPNSYIVGSE